jgi:hypothetical protein
VWYASETNENASGQVPVHRLGWCTKSSALDIQSSFYKHTTMNASAPKDQALSLPTPSTSRLDELLHMQSVDMVTIYQPPNPFDNNAALWLKHLPQGCTIPQLIQAISSVGPIGRILLGSSLREGRLGCSDIGNSRQRWTARLCPRLLDVLARGVASRF